MSQAEQNDNALQQLIDADSKTLTPKKKTGGRKAIYTTEERKLRHKESLKRSREARPEIYGRKTIYRTEVAKLIEDAVGKARLESPIRSKIESHLLAMMTQHDELDGDPKNSYAKSILAAKIEMLRDITSE